MQVKKKTSVNYTINKLKTRSLEVPDKEDEVVLTSQEDPKAQDR